MEPRSGKKIEIDRYYTSIRGIIGGEKVTDLQTPIELEKAQFVRSIDTIGDDLNFTEW